MKSAALLFFAMFSASAFANKITLDIGAFAYVNCPNPTVFEDCEFKSVVMQPMEFDLKNGLAHWSQKSTIGGMSYQHQITIYETGTPGEYQVLLQTSVMNPAGKVENTQSYSTIELPGKINPHGVYTNHLEMPTGKYAVSFLEVYGQ